MDAEADATRVAAAMRATRKSARPSAPKTSRFFLLEETIASLPDLRIKRVRQADDSGPPQTVHAKTRWRTLPLRPANGLLLVVDLDAEFLAHLLDIDVHRSDDLLVRMGLAIDNDAVLQLLGAIDLHLAEVREAVVPAAVPDGHEIGVFLPGAGQLLAGQLLNVEIAVGVRICAQVDLRLPRADAKHRHRAQ